MKFYSKEQLEKIGLKSLANNVNQYNYSILSGGGYNSLTLRISPIIFKVVK